MISPTVRRPSFAVSLSILRSARGILSLLLLTALVGTNGCSKGTGPGQTTPAAAPSGPSSEEASTPETPAASSPAKVEPLPAPPPEMTAPAPAAATPPAETAIAAVTLPPLPDPAKVPYSNPVSADRAKEGWISLFDGHSLMGWRRHDDGANWTVRDGVITADAGPIDLLCTSVPFADYELEVDFRLAAGGNSGVFLRTLPKIENPAVDCYELNIADTHPAGFITGSFVGRKKSTNETAEADTWQTFKVHAKGNRFQVYLDGHLVLDYTDRTSDAQRASGLIGLQHNKGKVEFRNIFLRPLGGQALFNGTDLAGWKNVPGNKGEVKVADGAIHVTGGLGFVESEGQWGDFVFQGESMVNAPETNSGYFFRALPIEDGGNCNGYELQIDNNFKDGDRSQPTNSGTGAIFRRAEARYVVPENNQWFTTTLVAHGPRMAVWVNGYQVVDFEDDRPADENPRRGLRVAPGHIALQGHDPTTNVSFRNLRAVEIPAPKPAAQ